ncbi:Uncharacterised protein [Vibrio cholerae]|nr:Uncharacterised protein [Vibrio cholerae]
MLHESSASWQDHGSAVGLYASDVALHLSPLAPFPVSCISRVSAGSLLRDTSRSHYTLAMDRSSVLGHNGSCWISATVRG